MAKVSKKSTDPRTLRTRKMLRDALFALLDEKHFDVITVLEITDRAGLNAATFYLHYDDKWDLLNSIVAELSAIVDEHPQSAFKMETDENGVVNLLEHSLFEHIAQYRDFYRLMLGKHGVASVRHALQGEFQRIIHQVLQNLPSSLESGDVPMELVEHSMAGAYVALIEWWVTKREVIPPRQLAYWVEKLWQIGSNGEFLGLFKHVD